MQVFLVRHADAVDESSTLPDPYTHLAPRGREQARALGDRLRWHDVVPTLIWSSPLVRAVQTAELVATSLACECAVACRTELLPDGNVRDVASAVRALADEAAVMLVGHEPHLSSIGAVITGNPDFKTLDQAQAARIVDGILRWRFAWDAEAPTVIAGTP